MPNKADVLVTGAAGRIGTFLRRQLPLCGHTVTGIDQGAPDLPSVDIRDRTALSRHFAESPLPPPEVVVHLAALAHTPDWGDAAELERVNVEGTRNVAEAAADAGVRRLVFASSVDVYDPRAYLAGQVDEGAPRRPATLYGRTKHAAEEALRERAGAFESVTVLRFAPVYGPGVLDDLRKRVGLTGSLGYSCSPRRRRIALTHLENVAEAVRLAIQKPSPELAIFNVRDARHVSQEQIRRYLGRFEKLPDLVLPLPGGLARLLLRLLLSPPAPLPTGVKSALLKAFGDTRLDITALRGLGYQGGAGLTAETPR